MSAAGVPADIPEHWKDVALSIFKYISLLRSQPPSSTVFNEIKAIADISFRFAERSKTDRYVTGLSTSMQHPVPREKIVSAGSLFEDFRADELAAALQLLDPRRATIGVTSRELPPGVEGTYDRTEPIYGTEYKQMRLGDDFYKEVSLFDSPSHQYTDRLQALSGSTIPDLQLPGPNQFIPEKLDVEKFEVVEVRSIIRRIRSRSRA